MTATTLHASELDAALQQAIRHAQAGQFADAERLFRGVLQARPDQPGLYNNLGIALQAQGKLNEAVEVFQRAVKVAPEYAPAHSNLGNILYEQGRLPEAEASYRRAIALRPDMADAHKNLGTVMCDLGRYTESFPPFMRHAELVYGNPANAARREPTPPAKARHDQEQREYLNGATVVGSPALFHFEDGGRVAGPAVNPDNALAEITAQWRGSAPQYVVIDNFLTDEALNKLRRFCWGSTVWHKSYANGYLGAMPEHGFVFPLLQQIDEEMRSTYPAVLGEHPLLHWWGFKYDSQLKGINLHADFAAVNVNFWITPDEANLNPESGGLVIWDTPAPRDWNFKQYNGGGQAVRDFLIKEGAHSVTVPYRANRAVVFDSDLFHETDKIDFKEGYLNRRINITMLYGKREAVAERD